MGFLYNISAEDATVALRSVRSFGTEGRMAEQGQPNLEVLPGSEVYDYVTFRGSDVKDLSVLDTHPDQVQPIPFQAATYALTPEPTAVISTDQDSEKASSNVLVATATSVEQPTGASVANGNRQQDYSEAPEPTRVSNKEPTKTFTSSQLVPGQTPEAQQTRGPENTDGDFDFEKANARFRKEEQDDSSLKAVYNKSSLFFDSISLNNHGNMRWSEEKNLNMDTFGESYVRRGRGNWRGRGRGRSSWRGRSGTRGNRGKQESIPEWA